MIKKMFNTGSFLLKNTTSLELYSKYAANLPVVDYHCHLKPYEIYNNKKFKNITELWLGKDHYKWRLMRANGIEESRITGEASDKDKFLAWAQTIERCPGNPLYYWTHMELKRYFNIDYPLNSQTAERVWKETNAQLGDNGLGACDFIEQSQVRFIGTTDDPLSDLEFHKKLRNTKSFQVVPTFRLDNLLSIESGSIFDDIFNAYKVRITTLTEYMRFIVERMTFFKQQGCRSTDLGISTIKWTAITTKPNETFVKLQSAENITEQELQDLKTYILIEIMKVIYDFGWVFQLHFGALGSVNEEAKRRLGTGTGFDTIVDQGDCSSGLLYLFNQVNNEGKLPKTVLFNIDGVKNSVVQTIMGCFQDNEAGIRGKVQHGPAWWFQDTVRGNRRQIEDLAEQGILMNFIGMTTDSRSFLSYARHDFFRRILCDLLGNWIEDGEMAYDEPLIKKMIEAICYENALKYFDLE